MLFVSVAFSRVSRASHPPGSSEGTSLASEILRRFRQLQMDHTWTESLYATLQFPDRSVGGAELRGQTALTEGSPVCLVTCRSQRSALWLLDSAGLTSEQILLNPSDFCPYSATGSTTVRRRQDGCVTMVTTTPVIFTCLPLCRGAWSTPTTAVRRILIG